uniref:Stromal cell-derived factor 1 n=1 Tax=Sus scrofa TaxID=9823 RepID=A0A4X1VAQ0_PIG
MGVKVLAVLALVLTALCLSDEKPVSLSYRCPCRFFESHVARANIKHLKILNTPNCALQIVARLKSNNRQVCIDPKLKWIQEYLEKALNNFLQPSGPPRLITPALAAAPPACTGSFPCTWRESGTWRPSPTLSGLTSALGSSLASTTVGITSRS